MKRLRLLAAFITAALIVGGVVYSQAIHTATRNLKNTFSRIQTYIAGIQLVGNSNVTRQITVAWNASPSTEVASYNVYRANVSGGPYTKIIGNIRNTNYVDLAVIAGGLYCYVVTAVAPPDSTPESIYSNESCSTLTGGSVTVQAPASVTPYTWTLPASPGSVGYYLCNTVTPGLLDFCPVAAGVPFVPGGDVSGTAARPIVSGLYGIKISGAPNAQGQTLVYNATLGQFVPTLISAPPSAHSLTVTWTASSSPNVTSYNVYRSNVSGGPYALKASAGGGTTYTDTSASVAGTKYCYVITSVAPIDTIPESLNSTEACATIPGGGIVHTANISWSASNSSGVTGYFVYRSTTNGGPYTRITPSLVSGLAFADGNVVSGSTYYYVVTAYAPTDTIPESVKSTQVAAVIP